MAGVDSPQGEGWWQASDGKWYPPETHPDYRPPPPPRPLTATGDRGGGAETPLWRRPWVIIVAGLLIVVIVVAALVADSDDGADTATTDAPVPTGADPSDAGEPAEPDGTTSSTASTISTTTSATGSSSTTSTTSTAPGQPPAGTGEDDCTYLGVDDFGDMQVELRVTSPLSNITDITITYGLEDADDIRFLTELAFVDRVYPGEKLRVQSDTLAQLPASVTDVAAIRCEILGVEDSGFGDTPQPPSEASCEYIGLDFADDIQVEISVSSPFDVTTDLWVTYALRGPEQVRFGWSLAIIELVGPAEFVRVLEDTVTDVPGWLGESEISCDVLTVEQSPF